MKKIQVLGPGCPNCERLAQNAETAARELGISRKTLWEKIKNLDISVDF